MISSPAASSFTLALVADRFDEPYQQAILRTAEEAAQQRGVHLLAFAGGIPGSTVRGNDKRSVMFDLVGPGTVDGVVFLAGTMVNQLGMEGVTRVLGRLEGLPVCAVGLEVAGVPSILVDNEGGVRKAMRHLISHHGAARVGFLGGPVRNKEAEERYAGYRSEMERANLAIDDRFVVHGDFLRASGVRAVEHWLGSDAKALPDSIFCANDEMALGAIAALVKAGVRVPEDVRVIGFDGVEIARLSNPPLTTVRQALDDLALMSIRTVMDQIAGRKVAPLQKLETHLVVRESCGCLLQLTSTGQSQVVDEAVPSQRSGGEGFSAAFQRFRAPLQAELARAARGEFSAFAGWDTDLINAFSEQIETRNPAFTQTLSQLLGRVRGKGHDVSRFQDVVSAFRRFALPCAGSDQQLRTHTENVLQEARIIIAQTTERAFAERHIELERFAFRLSAVGHALSSSYDWVELARVACRELPRLGVDAFYLCAYLPDAGHEVTGRPLRARLVAAFDTESGFQQAAPSSDDFDVAALLPEAFGLRSANTRPRQFSVLPLFSRDEQLGYCLIQAKGGRAALHEALRDHLSTALAGARLKERAKS